MQYDVVIVGGGPAGSTCGSFLKKYRPELQVGILERARFPRDHVGESQLPIIGAILNEIGVWEKVEAAGFPIKIGGTYRWGRTDELWDFHFLPNGVFEDAPRPSRYSGQRMETAFQVDRASYDKILLDHARELGCDVHEGVGVKFVECEGDSVQRLVLGNGESVLASHYVDATGHLGLLRRSLGIEVDEPSALQNVAGWDYWQNAEWAVTLGNGGTRIQVMSLGYGWLWFIPISETRTSVGFVCPAEYYRRSGRSMEQLYLDAVSSEPRISALTANATRDCKFQSTKDWSFVSKRMTGENWILVGEAAGFADPILSAGLSLTHTSAREAAFTLIEIERGQDREWLRKVYEDVNRRKILQHIRFADYWYSANGHFTDLKEFTREIARDAGLEFSADDAFQWLGTGGFIEEDMQVAGLGTVNLARLHQVMGRLSEQQATSPVDGSNGFELNLAGATKTESPNYTAGKVQRVATYERNGKKLPLRDYFGLLVEAFSKTLRVDVAVTAVARYLREIGKEYDSDCHGVLVQCLEAMVRDGWLLPVQLPDGHPIRADFSEDRTFIANNRDAELPEASRAKGLFSPLSNQL